MPREDRMAKAKRLVRDGCVEIVRATSEDYWTAIVEGDNGTYLTERTPEGRFCECTWGGERDGGCSHYQAAEAVAFSWLAEREGVTS